LLAVPVDHQSPGAGWTAGPERPSWFCGPGADRNQEGACTWPGCGRAAYQGRISGVVGTLGSRAGPGPGLHRVNGGPRWTVPGACQRLEKIPVQAVGWPATWGDDFLPPVLGGGGRPGTGRPLRLFYPTPQHPGVLVFFGIPRPLDGIYYLWNSVRKYRVEGKTLGPPRAHIAVAGGAGGRLFPRCVLG